MTLYKTLLATTVAVVALGGVAIAAMNPIPSDPLTTTSGKVSGTRLASGVKAYFGIPYAKPPVQALRWAPPQPVKWDGVFNADHKGPECIQVLRQHKLNHYFGEEATSEDCLYMNIWAPAGATANSKLPVVVFIYGGGGTVGSSGPALYGGEDLAKHNAIFVNFNYRVGLFGYMSHPALSAEQGGHSGNYGYLDQNAALKWVHENIAAFGGDPSKVIITGQSFGASSVVAQVSSPLSKGLFRAAAMWSACSYDAPAVPLVEAEKIGLDVQKRLDVPNLEALRDVPADRILGIQEEHQLGANVIGVRVPPTIDGYFWTQGKLDALAAHQFNDVPIIATSNTDDIDAGRTALVNAHTVAEYRDTATKMYGPDADAFLKLYPVATDADVQPMAHKAAWEGGFLRQSQTCGVLQSRYNKSATYVGLFGRKHPYAPGAVISDQNPATIGAYHTADVPYWLGSFDAFNMFRTTRNWTPADRDLSDVMMGSLIAMADHGDANTPKFKWPAWTPAKQDYAVFKNGAVAQAMDAKAMDWQAAHPPAPVVARPERSAETRD